MDNVATHAEIDFVLSIPNTFRARLPIRVVSALGTLSGGASSRANYHACSFVSEGFQQGVADCAAAGVVAGEDVGDYGAGFHTGTRFAAAVDDDGETVSVVFRVFGC